jgi:hypothetical protein
MTVGAVPAGPLFAPPREAPCGRRARAAARGSPPPPAPAARPARARAGGPSPPHPWQNERPTAPDPLPQAPPNAVFPMMCSDHPAGNAPAPRCTCVVPAPAPLSPRPVASNPLSSPLPHTRPPRAPTPGGAAPAAGPRLGPPHSPWAPSSLSPLPRGPPAPRRRRVPAARPHCKQPKTPGETQPTPASCLATRPGRAAPWGRRAASAAPPRRAPRQRAPPGRSGAAARGTGRRGAAAAGGAAVEREGRPPGRGPGSRAGGRLAVAAVGWLL